MNPLIVNTKHDFIYIHIERTISKDSVYRLSYIEEEEEEEEENKTITSLSVSQKPFPQYEKPIFRQLSLLS